MDTQRHLDSREAARWLGLSPRTLETWRYLGSGPRFRRFGRAVRYAVEDLDAYARSGQQAFHRGAARGQYGEGEGPATDES